MKKNNERKSDVYIRIERVNAPKRIKQQLTKRFSSRLDDVNNKQTHNILPCCE